MILLPTPMSGECPHICKYCYVQPQLRKPVLAAKYSGEPRIEPGNCTENFGRGHIIFVQNMSDLFAANVPDSAITTVLNHCISPQNGQGNHFLTLTKNSDRYEQFKEALADPRFILGSTIESDVHYDGTKAPTPQARMLAMVEVSKWAPASFISIEPIMKFTPEFSRWLKEIQPTFVAIGANTTASVPLPEPDRDLILLLVASITMMDARVNQPSDLEPARRAKASGPPALARRVLKRVIRLDLEAATFSFAHCAISGDITPGHPSIPGVLWANAIPPAK
jgi:hypothetical protein